MLSSLRFMLLLAAETLVLNWLASIHLKNRGLGSIFYILVRLCDFGRGFELY